jgi:hypothetical protein
MVSIVLPSSSMGRHNKKALARYRQLNLEISNLQTVNNKSLSL